MLELLGWTGAVGLLIAFMLSSFGQLDSRGTIYHLVNMVCAILLLINAYYNKAYPFLFINAFWTVTSGVALVKNYTKQKIST